MGEDNDMAAPTGGQTATREALQPLYESAIYRVVAPEGDFVLRVGARSKALDRLLAARGVRSSAYLTAANPGSHPLAEKVNRDRNARMTACLDSGGWSYLPGVSGAARGDWPAEESFLVFGISDSDALDLARQFEQVALLIAARGAPVRLVFVEG